MPNRYNTATDGHLTQVESFANLLAAKKRAADARFVARDENLEEPGEVFRSSCQVIAERLEEYGFKYAKSGPRCTRRAGDMTVKLLFLSDNYNVAGEHVALSVIGEVGSREYKKWGLDMKLWSPSDQIVSGQLGYLCNDQLDLTWELACPDFRADVVAGVVRAIEEIALPFFARFDDIEQLRHDLVSGSVPMMDVTAGIQYLLCFGTRQEAVTAGRHFFEKRTDLIGPYRQELEHLHEREPLKVRGQGWAKELAIVSHFFELGDLTAAKD